MFEQKTQYYYADVNKRDSPKELIKEKELIVAVAKILRNKCSEMTVSNKTDKHGETNQVIYIPTDGIKTNPINLTTLNYIITTNFSHFPIMWESH
jgi:hypothetical protein